MSNTYTQIYIHIIFSVQSRQNLLKEPWRYDLFRYISGIITNKGQKSIIVNGMSDHIHIFVGLTPTMNISALVRDIKNNSSKYINNKKYFAGKFAWQKGYAAFSYSSSQIEQVYNYIKNQEQHHKQKTFKEEYINLLQKFDIKYNEKYLFDISD